MLHVLSQNEVSIDKNSLQIGEEAATVHVTSNDGSSKPSILIRTDGECDIRICCSQERCAHTAAAWSLKMNATDMFSQKRVTV